MHLKEREKLMNAVYTCPKLQKSTYFLLKKKGSAGVNVTFSTCSIFIVMTYIPLKSALVPVGLNSLWIEYPNIYECLSQRGPEIPRTYIKPGTWCCVGTVKKFFAGKG